MRKLIFALLSAGLLWACFLLFPFLSLVNEKLAYFVYKEITYVVIINKVIGNEKRPLEKAILMNDFIYNYFSSPYGAKIVDKDVYNDLIRGIAWCDQRAWALTTFMGKLGIDGEMVFTKKHDRISTHSISEILFGKKQQLFDPQFGFFGYNTKGEVASYEEICLSPEIFYQSPKMLKLKLVDLDRYLKLRSVFSSDIYYPDFSMSVRWKNPVLKRNFIRRNIGNLTYAYVRIYGANFVNFYQDIYLKIYSPKKAAEKIYVIARNYDLYSRFELATTGYEKIIAKYPKSERMENALYFLGILEHNKKMLDSSITKFNSLLTKYPETIYRASAYYYLGYNYEEKGNYLLAKKNYEKALKIYKESSPDLLTSDEMKVVERLFGILDRAKSGDTLAWQINNAKASSNKIF